MPEKIESQPFLFVHKPAGVATHKPHEDQWGFVEYCQVKENQKLWVCHRLDKDTSGAMVFARSKKAAQELGELFTKRQVQKTYLLISDKKSSAKQWRVERGDLDAPQGERPGKQGGNNTSEITVFVRVNDQGSLYLYEAYPLTGKTHQIRKHALESKIPILGDELYGGTKFPRLMLHARSLSFDCAGEKREWRVDPSPLFNMIDTQPNLEMAAWQAALDRRQALYPEAMTGSEAIRLFHKESLGLRGDKVGEHWVLGWWRSQAPSHETLENLKQFMNAQGPKSWRFQWRPGSQNKESHEVLLGSSAPLPEVWAFTENGVSFEARRDQGQNFGLFLDQRQRRQWLKERAKNKEVLNLFSFTCGFSVYAALGGAKRVVSVDSSGPYLEWGRKNFQINGLDDQSYEFRKMDALSYLDFAVKKGLRFDYVVCDPPSFSRNKKNKSSFHVKKDFNSLLELCATVVAPGGTLLFSTNFEQWSFSGLKAELESQASNLGFAQVEWSPSQWDHEWQVSHANLKAFFLHKP